MDSTQTALYERRRRALLLGCGYGFVALVIYLSLVRIPPDVDVGVDLDLGHVIAYFWLMIWFAQVIRPIGARLRLAIGLFCMGVALEYVQGAIGYRHFDYFDMLRNLSGLALGFVLALTPLQNASRALESWAMSRRRPAGVIARAAAGKPDAPPRAVR